MWKSWLKRLFSSSGQRHPLDRKPVPLDKHPLGQQVANLIFFSQNEAKRLQHHIISSEHILLALTKYPNGLAQQALKDLGVETEKVEALIPPQVTASTIPEGAFLISKEAEAIFQKARDEAKYFKSDQIAPEHVVLALTHFENTTAYQILQQLNVTPKLLREKVYSLSAANTELGKAPSQTNSQKVERFTTRSRLALSISQKVTEERKDGVIRVEYLLIALLREDGGVAARTLKELGITLDKLEPIIYTAITSVPSNDKDPELSPEVKKALELAVDEARRLRHHYIGTEHLLLGLMRQNKLLPVKVLGQLGVTPQMVCDKIKVIWAQQATPNKT